MSIRLTDTQLARLRLLESDGGSLRPSVLVADAKRPDSPLHALFDWDITSAAEHYWLDRARTIIRSVKLVITTETTTLRAPMYVRDPDEGRQDGYRRLTSLAQSPETARDALKAELVRAAGVMARARTLAEALGMSEEFDEMLTRIAGLQRRVAGPLEADDPDVTQPHQ